MAKRRKPEPFDSGAVADGDSLEVPLNVILSLAPEPSAVEESLPPPAPLPVSYPPPETVSAGPPGAVTEAQQRVPPPRERRVDRLGRRLSPRLTRLLPLFLALLLLALIVSSWSTSAAGTIFPDWGLASLRIGFAAALVGIVFLPGLLFICQARARPLPISGGVLGVVLLIISAGGILGSAPLHRAQGLWFEGRGQYGLALAAYQDSGDTLTASQDMARLSVEWAEQLSAQHDYQDAVPQLEPVVRLYNGDAALVARARMDLIQDYLAWGDQARQQSAFQDALTHYHALQQAAYCDAACQQQVHAQTAQALLGLAQQLTANKQYDKAVAAYQQIVQGYGDTPEAARANQALTAPQTLTGRLVYANNTPAKQFQVLLASQWSFNARTQVFTLLGQQYRVRADAAGQFVVPAVVVGATYMLAWVDTSGHAGTCYTSNNQPLYTIAMQPLRAADVGSIDIECA
jgi:tetratricopeptide (TPR) repeat protein